MKQIRILFMQKGCQHCRLYLGIIEKFNVLLKPEKRVRVIDVTDSWNRGIDLSEIPKYIELKGTPSLYLNGIILEGVTTREYLKGFLKGYFVKTGELNG